MSKKWCLAPIILMLAVFAASCTRVQDDRIKITYQTMETLPEQRKALAVLVSEFEKKHPNIKVEVFTSTTSFQKLSIQIAGGNAPDVFYYITDRLPGLVYRDVLLDLSPFVASVDMTQYFPQAAESCRINGKYWCFPFHYSTDVLFYNKDLFDKQGLDYPDSDWTWQDYLTTAQKLTKKVNDRTVQFGTLQPRPLLLIKSFGGRCFDAKLTSCTLDSKETREALQFIMDMDSRYGVAPSAASIKDMERMDGIDMFSTGRVAMFLGRTFMLAEFRKLKSFNWDIAPVPSGIRPYSRLAVGGNCISASTKYPKEAWEFVKFFSGKEGSLICGVSGNCVPALKEVSYSDVFLNPPPENARLFVDSIEYSESDNPGLIVWEEFYQRVVQGNIDKILCKTVSMEDGIKKMVRDGMKLLQQEKEARKL